MPRVMVTTDDGEMLWNEGVNTSDFEDEHFRRALVDRVGWAVADAESSWHLTTAKPVHIDTARKAPDKQVAAQSKVLAA